MTKLAGEYAALAYADSALVVRTGGLYGLKGSASKGGNFVQRMISRAREQGSLRVVDDQRLQPTFTSDLAAAIVAAVEGDAHGLVHLTSSGSCVVTSLPRRLWSPPGLMCQIEPVNTETGPGTIDRPLNAVLSRPRADALDVPVIRPWREALDDYTERAQLTAVASMLEAGR